MLMMEMSSDNDIFCGRGKGRWNSPGNLKLKEIVLAHLQAYADAPTKTAKSRVVETVVTKAKDRQLRFVKEDKDDGGWYEISPSEIRAKVAHCVRDQYQTMCKKNLIVKPHKNAAYKKRKRSTDDAPMSGSKGSNGRSVVSKIDIDADPGSDLDIGLGAMLDVGTAAVNTPRPARGGNNGGASSARRAQSHLTLADASTADQFMNANMDATMGAGMDMGTSHQSAALNPDTAALLASQQQYLASLNMTGAPPSTNDQNGSLAAPPANQLFPTESQIGSRAMPSRLLELQNSMAAGGSRHSQEVNNLLARQNAGFSMMSRDHAMESLARMQNTAAMRANNIFHPSASHVQQGANMFGGMANGTSGLSASTVAGTSNAGASAGHDFRMAQAFNLSNDPQFFSGHSTDPSNVGPGAAGMNLQGSLMMAGAPFGQMGSFTGNGHLQHASDNVNINSMLGTGTSRGFGGLHRRDSISQTSIGPALDANSGNRLLGLGGAAFRDMDGTAGTFISGLNDGHQGLGTTSTSRAAFAAMQRSDMGQTKTSGDAQQFGLSSHSRQAPNQMNSIGNFVSGRDAGGTPARSGAGPASLAAMQMQGGGMAGIAGQSENWDLFGDAQQQRFSQSANAAAVARRERGLAPSMALSRGSGNAVASDIIGSDRGNEGNSVIEPNSMFSTPLSSSASSQLNRRAGTDM